MTTRSSRRNVADTEDITPSEVEAGRQNLREYFAKIEENVLQKLTDLVMKPDRIRNIAEDAFSDTVLRIDNSLRQLAESHNELRNELNAFRQEPCKKELQVLTNELAAVRERVNGEFQKLWSAIDTLKGKRPQERKETDEPIRVRGSEEENDELPNRHGKGKNSKEACSRKSRSKKSRHSKQKRRGRRSEEWDDYSSSESEESDADLNDPDGDEIRVADKDCRKVLNVETYRLEDRDPERDLALRTTKVLANLRHLFDGERFDGSDPLSVLPFLEELRATFDDAGLSEGDARHMVRYFLTGEAARLFKGLSPRDKRSYPRIIKWLLRTYVRESMLQNAREEFLTRAQKSTETELEYSQALSSLAKRCAGMIPSRDLTNRFVRGLRPAIRTQVQSRVAKNTSWAVAVAIATEHGNAHREAQKEQDSGRDPPFFPYSRRRATTGKGKALVIREPKLDESSDQDEVWIGEEDPSVFDARGGDPIGAIRHGPFGGSRDSSYASLPTSVGSSGERYYTPQPSFIGRDARVRSANNSAERVILPPGTPFPAKPVVRQSPQGPSQPNAYPCLGCGKTGHWLSECQNVNARLKDLALEALRARKQARRLKFDERRDPSPGRFRNVFQVRDEEESDAAVQTEERDVSAEETG